MKLLKKPKCDVLRPENWKCFDGCPLCRLLEKAAEEGLELSQKEIDDACAKAEEQAVD